MSLLLLTVNVSQACTSSCNFPKQKKFAIAYLRMDTAFFIFWRWSINCLPKNGYQILHLMMMKHGSTSALTLTNFFVYCFLTYLSFLKDKGDNNWAWTVLAHSSSKDAFPGECTLILYGLSSHPVLPQWYKTAA